MPANELKKQLEETRFNHTVDYVNQNAGGLKRLGVAELLHLNQMLNHTTDSTWRTQPVEIQLPSGKKRALQMISNSMEEARVILANCYNIIAQGDLIEAAVYLYSHLVMNHFFNEANRRTAVVATCWLLQEAGKKINAHTLLKAGLGDLSDPASLHKLRQKIKSLVKA